MAFSTKSAHTCQNERNTRTLIEESTRRVFPWISLSLRFPRILIYLLTRNDALSMQGRKRDIRTNCKKLSRRGYQLFIKLLEPWCHDDLL
jgi:hypothetical protein